MISSAPDGSCRRRAGRAAAPGRDRGGGRRGGAGGGGSSPLGVVDMMRAYAETDGLPVRLRPRPTFSASSFEPPCGPPTASPATTPRCPTSCRFRAPAPPRSPDSGEGVVQGATREGGVGAVRHRHARSRVPLASCSSAPSLLRAPMSCARSPIQHSVRDVAGGVRAGEDARRRRPSSVRPCVVESGSRRPRLASTRGRERRVGDVTIRGVRPAPSSARSRTYGRRWRADRGSAPPGARTGRGRRSTRPPGRRRGRRPRVRGQGGRGRRAGS